MIRICCIGKNSEMCMGEFTDIIRKCVSDGADQFDLTPVKMDPFIDPLIHERIGLLATTKQVKKIKVSTNMLKEGPIFASLKCPKIELNVVVYANTRSLFKTRVGSDMFGLFVKNFRNLIEYVYHHPELKSRVIIHKAFPGKFSQPNLHDYNDLSRWIIYSMKMKMTFIDDTVRNSKDKEVYIFPGGDIQLEGQSVGNIHSNRLREVVSVSLL